MTRQERNEAALKTLHPQFAVRLRLLLKRAEEMRGMELLIVQARRSFSDQQKLYLGGAQAAPPGHSYHELGLAADLVDVRHGTEPGRYDPADWDATDYDWIAGEALALGLISGHKWTHRDSPHVEYHPGFTPRQASVLATIAAGHPVGLLPDNYFEGKA